MNPRKKIVVMAILLVVAVLVGVASTSLQNQSSHGGQVGMSAGTGSDSAVQALRTEFGVHVHYEISSVDSRPLDVYLVTLDQLTDYRVNGTFTYFQQGSATNVTGFVSDQTLDASHEVYDLLIVSNVTGANVPFTLSFQQAPSHCRFPGRLTCLRRCAGLGGDLSDLPALRRDLEEEG
jgi:hypothetical protein